MRLQTDRAPGEEEEEHKQKRPTSSDKNIPAAYGIRRRAAPSSLLTGGSSPG
jgi:hypothetical protein